MGGPTIVGGLVGEGSMVSGGTRAAWWGECEARARKFEQTAFLCSVSACQRCQTPPSASSPDRGRARLSGRFAMRSPLPTVFDAWTVTADVARSASYRNGAELFNRRTRSARRL